MTRKSASISAIGRAAVAVAMPRDGNWKPAAASLKWPINVVLPPVLKALRVAINVTLVVTDVAELGDECARWSRQPETTSAS